ncbi:lipoprotein-releasing system permease protein [Tenacibaculum adriaticum]|uniref:Lipoprotein-releasing system permease protein n=1 Tax=Tenacibaculum adriaticum TaxID=413713 RepID=A0A5S5DWJ8_9FLAO|nr:ABC transporter permease [Tenacibaculum adriaticum]TYQ00105.1 lipoprotein-releasing system permease protein [Tenacibaculum adriaticum]
MNFPLYIAKRYLFSKSSTNAINIITLIATFGVIVGSLALFIILSGFSGLRTFSYSLLNTSDPDIKITAVKGKTFLFTSDVEQILIQTPSVKDYSKVVEERVFLKHKDKSHIANIKGVDQKYTKVVAIDSSLSVGTWVDSEFKNTAVIGNGISYKLSLGILNFGESLEIYVPKSGTGFINPNNAFRSVNAQVIGVYNGSEEFQNKYVFTELKLAQELLNYNKNQISALEIKLISSDLVNNIKEELQNQLGSAYKVETREQLNALFYKVINTENFVSYLIFTLIVIIALFNVIGAIIMMIIDKRKNLKTLFNLGTSVQNIKKIFVLQGFLLTLVGMAIGLTIGILLVLVQQRFGLFMITQNIPYPVEFRWANLLVVIGTISVLGFLAAQIASSRISESFVEK